MLLSVIASMLSFTEEVLLSLLFFLSVKCHFHFFSCFSSCDAHVVCVVVALVANKEIYNCACIA